MTPCSSHGKFLIEDPDNSELSRWVYSCAEHLGTLIEDVLLDPRTTVVKVYEQCNTLEPLCQYGARS